MSPASGPSSTRCRRRCASAGSVLADGTDVAGFLCEPLAAEGARDITAFGGWRAFRASG